MGIKLTRDFKPWHPGHGNANSFIDHLEWYLFQHLFAGNYRVDPNQGILRFPLNDVATSQCITKGVLCRGSPIFVPEVSSVNRRNFIFPYHIEIECPTTFCDLESDPEMKQRVKDCVAEKDAYQLTTRKWFIDDGDDVETVQGPGVIGLYPKVFVNQELFQYESCSQQKVATNGEMWGFFVFQRGDDQDDTFELEIKPYKLDWDCCQWI